MQTLVVYDSVHGNTREVAEEVARSLGRSLSDNGDVQLIHIHDFKMEYLADIDLLVLGAPVRRHDVSPAVEKFLEGLPACALHGLAVATFDTRYQVQAWLSGSAAGKMARLLRRLGARQVAQAESFRLDTKMGPLSPGELERAEVWAASLPDRLSTAA
jgi:flavodoxin